MNLLWDEPKRLANLKKHGLDFGDAPLFDWPEALIEAASADRFGRTRVKAIGRFEGKTVSIIFATLGSEANFNRWLQTGKFQGKDKVP